MSNDNKSKFEINGTVSVHANITSSPEPWRISSASVDSFRESQGSQVTVKGEQIPVPTSEQFVGDLKKASRRMTK